MTAFPDFLVSVTPFFLILGLMAGLRWGLVRTGLAAWAWTLAAAAFAFGIGPFGVGVSLAKAAILALDVLPIVWGALLFFSVCEQAGAVRILGDELTAAIPWKSLRGLLLGWAFASFLQGAGGFGVPVVVTAPLLWAAGFPPLAAVVLPFVGHSWAVTFGSLGTSFQALMSASGLSAQTLAGPAAILLGGLCILAGLLVGWLGSKEDFPHLLPVLLLAGAAMAGTQYLLATAGFWQIASLGAGAVGSGLLYGAGRISARTDAAAPKPPGREFLFAAAGYVLLVAVILFARWFEPLRDMLDSIRWNYSLPGAETSRGFAAPGTNGYFLPFGNSGAILAYASLAVFLWYRRKGWYPPDAVRGILRATAHRAAPVSIGIVSMIGVSTLLSYSGMTSALAAGLAGLVGAAYPALSPWLGAGGAFLTGSNTNSNLLFAPLQQDMARTLGLSPSALLAAQTGGGAVGSVLSPAKVGVGAIGLRDGPSEGEVMRRLLLPIGLLLAAASAGTLLLLVFSP
jgi:lactate permease